MVAFVWVTRLGIGGRRQDEVQCLLNADSVQSLEEASSGEGTVVRFRDDVEMPLWLIAESPEHVARQIRLSKAKAPPA